MIWLMFTWRSYCKMGTGLEVSRRGGGGQVREVIIAV